MATNYLLNPRTPGFLKKNPDFVLASSIKNPFSFQHADPSFKSSRDFFLKAVEHDPLILGFADENIRNDEEIFLKAFRINKNVLSVCGKSLQANKEYFLEALKDPHFVVHDLNFATLPVNILKDTEIALLLNERNPDLILQLDRSIFSDRNLCLALSKKNTFIQDYMDEKFFHDPEIMINLIKEHRSLIDRCDPSLFENPKFMLDLINLDYRFFERAHPALKTDKAFVMDVVTANGKALSLLNPSFFKDSDVLCEAAKTFDEAINFIDPSLHRDLGFAQAMIKIRPEYLRLCDKELQKDPDLVFEAVCLNGLMLEFAHEDLRNNDKIVGKAVEVNPLSIQFASQEIQENKELMIPLISSYPNLITYFDKAHPFYEELAYHALLKNPDTIYQIDKDVAKDPDFLKTVLKAFGYQIELVDQIALLNREDLRIYLFKKYMQSGLADTLKELEPFKSTSSITPLFMKLIMKSWNMSQDHIETLDAFLTSKNLKALKDRDHKRMPILEAFRALDESDLTSEEKLNFFMKALKKDNLQETINILNLLPLALKSHPKQNLQALDPLTYLSLQDLVLKTFIDTQILDPKDIDAFIEITKNSRMPQAFFIFAKDILHDPRARIALTSIIKAICSKNFLALRHENNSYKDLLTEDQLRNWEQSRVVKRDKAFPIQDTEDWQDLLLSGTEVGGSCQRIDGEPALKTRSMIRLSQDVF